MQKNGCVTLIVAYFCIGIVFSIVVFVAGVVLKGLHNWGAIDTPDGRFTLVISTIVFVGGFLYFVWQAWADGWKDADWRYFGGAFVFSILASFFIWALHLWIIPFFERIQEWIETGT
jgi:hypothetical protein